MDHEAARLAMVESQVQRRGVESPAVLGALNAVPRHRFIPAENRDLAYRDGPVGIGEGQTISQPYLVGLMTDALDVSEGMRVLEIGTGSGFQTAVLAALGCRVTSVEIRPKLALRAEKNLRDHAQGMWDLRIGNGFEALEATPPFPRIIVTAAPREIPPALVDQLAEGGRMLIPTGPRDEQMLWNVSKEGGLPTAAPMIRVRFVPMTGNPH